MKVIVIFLIICSGHLASSFLTLMSDINTVVAFADFLNGQISPEEEPKDKTDDIVDALFVVSERLDEISDSVNNKLDQLSAMIGKMQHMEKVTKAKDELSEYINRIDELYEEFLAYADDTSSFNEKTIKNFVEEMTSHKESSLTNTLNKMHDLFVENRGSSIRESILDLLLGIDKTETQCNKPLTIQQEILQVYDMASLSEMRGFAITNFAYYSLAHFDKKPYKAEREKSLSQVLKRSMEYLKATKSALEKASRKYVRCDPKKWRRDVDFFELERLYQSFLVGEEQTYASCANSDILSWRKCHWYSTSQKYATFFGGMPSTVTRWNDHDYCLKQKCEGHLSRCTWVGTPTVCELEDDPLRRYSWVTGDGDVTYGEKKSCSEGVQKSIPTHRNGGRNNMCLCECAEEYYESNAVRAVSLLPSVSDVKNNMVVTGIRLSKQDKMIQIQIEEGKLLDSGTIEKDSVKWVESNKYVYVHDGEPGGFDLIKPDGSKERIENRKGFSWLWAYQRSINIDNIFAPKDYLLTGVKFAHDDSKVTPTEPHRWARNPLEVLIQITKFDFKSGKLQPDDQKWISVRDVKDPGKDYNGDRTELKIEQATDPLKATKENKEDSHPNQVLNFGMSDLKKDVGSYTIPYIDIQSVTPPTKSALGGIATLHRGTYGFGGFLGVATFHLDYSKYIQAALTPENAQKHQKDMGS